MMPRHELIVVGGSAGGIEALEVLLPAVTPSHPPVVVVLHLGPHRSGLADLMAARCEVPVADANDKDVLAPGRIYLAPSGYHLLVGPDRVLALSCDPPIHWARPSIDALFDSAAWAFGSKVLAIVLSGANDDGADGCAAVERAGGEVWIQKDAIFATMPVAARRAVREAVVVPVEELARKLRGAGSISTSRRDP